jgi:hypothetical protein
MQNFEYIVNKIKARTQLNEILWISFGVHTANAIRIAKRLAQEDQSNLVALSNKNKSIGY